MSDGDITILKAKWLDPECHHGCQSLIHKQHIKRLESLLQQVLEWCEQDSPSFEIDAESIRAALREHPAENEKGSSSSAAPNRQEEFEQDKKRLDWVEAHGVEIGISAFAYHEISATREAIDKGMREIRTRAHSENAPGEPPAREQK